MLLFELLWMVFFRSFWFDLAMGNPLPPSLAFLSYLKKSFSFKQTQNMKICICYHISGIMETWTPLPCFLKTKHIEYLLQMPFKLYL